MLTERQRKTLLFIEAEIQRTGGVAPTLREIADHLHYRSPTMARRLLTGLEERGFIRRLPGRERAIDVLQPVSRFAVFSYDRETRRLRRVPEKG
jgi:repressor LexA